MKNVLNLFPIVESVVILKQSTLEVIPHCQGIESIKKLCQIYDILELTDKINQQFNSPIKDQIVYDPAALSELRKLLGMVYISNDPRRNLFTPYMEKGKKVIHYYLHWESMYARSFHRGPSTVL